MADVRAVKSGVWSDTTVWNTGALPTANDDVWTNTFAVTIDTSPTVLSVRNGATTGVTAGGTLAISANGITLTCTGVGVVASNTSGIFFTVSVGTGNSALITSNVSNAAGGSAVVMTGAGTLTVQGNVISGNASGTALANTSTGTVNLIGNSTGGTGTNAYGMNNTSTGTVNITGNVTGGNMQNGANSAFGINNTSTGTVNITGNVTAGTNQPAGGGLCHGVNNNSTGTVNITGTVTGSSNAPTAYGFVNASTGTITHIGTAQGAVSSAAIGPGAVGQVTTLSGPLLSTDASAGGAAASGVNPCVALRWFPADNALSTFEYRLRGQTASGSPSARPARQLFLPDAYSATYPSAANVRNGTTYGPGSIYTGTCAVPGAASVLVGVPVDATTGTAVVSAADIRSAIGLASANLDTQLSNKPTAAQIRTELDSNSTKLANLDATVSSRLAGASYSAPLDAAGTRSAVGLSTGNLDTQLSGISSGISGLPSASAIASAVWGAATRTLTTAIDNSSTIAAAVWSYATGRTITGGTVDTLTNAPSVPSAATIASQVRTELSTELGRIDASVSSRLAPAGTLARVTLVDTATTLTNAPSVPSPQTVASAVRTELSAELAHLDADISSRQATLARLQNVATTQEVGDIVEEAMQP